MAAARQLKLLGYSITTYDQVLDRFFHTWLATHKQSVNTNSLDPNFGGIYSRVYYDTTGLWRSNAAPTTAVTGQMLAAMWKYYEYNVSIGNSVVASNWLQQGWDIARSGGDFIRRMTNATYNLVRGNSGGNDLWISDSAMSAAGLRCLDAWAGAAGKIKTFDYGAVANAIVAGLEQLKDNGSRKNFFKYRSSGSGYSPTYGDSIDQLCFLPYEAEVLDPVEPFCRSISDWWTTGSGGINMTYPVADTNDWRYFGTHWHYYFSPQVENGYLYPGPGLQLAKVEWKYARRTGDPVALDRARKRLQWAAGTNYSKLWFGAGNSTEANVANGLVDWRDSANFVNSAPTWQRFCDTSAYFIELVLMVYFDVNSKYIPNSDLSIRRQGSEAIVTWNGTGTLQSATDIHGQWLDITNSVSPFPATQSAEVTFYRLKN